MSTDKIYMVTLKQGEESSKLDTCKEWLFNDYSKAVEFIDKYRRDNRVKIVPSRTYLIDKIFNMVQVLALDEIEVSDEIPELKKGKGIVFKYQAE